MKKADMLNIIKDAEERASDLKAKAIFEKNFTEANGEFWIGVVHG